MSIVEQIFAAAMALPSRDRAKLASRLFDSVADGNEPDLEDKLEQLVVDRLAAYDRGEVEASDWEEVKARIKSTRKM